jgi:hypothetical protein
MLGETNQRIARHAQWLAERRAAVEAASVELDGAFRGLIAGATLAR